MSAADEALFLCMRRLASGGQAALGSTPADTPSLLAPARMQTPTRKIYMLTGIAPSVELTGGPWFTDNELDVELVETLKKVVRKFLQQKVRLLSRQERV